MLIMVRVIIETREYGVKKSYEYDLDTTEAFVNVEVKTDDGKIISYFEAYGIDE